jgi:hypothetical protein
MLGTNIVVTDFHLQDEWSFHIGHLFVQSREKSKIIWESHYGLVAENFNVEKNVAVMQENFYWLKL